MVDSDSSCPECGSRDFTRDDDELSCIACGLVLEDNIMESASGSSPFAPRQGRLETQTEWLTRTRKLSTSPAKITAIQNADEDPEWANSPVKVDSPPPPSAITPKGEHRFATLNKDAMTYLGANPSSDVDRSELFRPFYAIHPNLKQISDEEVKKNRPAVGIDKSLSKDFTISEEDKLDLRSRELSGEALGSMRFDELQSKVSHPHILPGPVCALDVGTNIPPRAYEVPTGACPNGRGPYRSLGPLHRKDFEMFLDLHQIQLRPWPLHKWSERILLGAHIHDILLKGGGLDFRASRYLLDMNDRMRGGITSDEVSGFMRNLIERAVVNFSNPIREKIEKETLSVLESLRNTVDPVTHKEKNLLDIFIDKNCLATHRDSSEPTIFWGFDEHKQIVELGHLKLISIPIAFAMAYAATVHIPSKSSIADDILDLAQTDTRMNLTNAKDVSGQYGLNKSWLWIMQRIGLDSSILFKQK